MNNPALSHVAKIANRIRARETRDAFVSANLSRVISVLRAATLSRFEASYIPESYHAYAELKLCVIRTQSQQGRVPPQNSH